MWRSASAACRRFAPFGACAVLSVLLAHCSNTGRIDSRWGVAASRRVIAPGEPVPKGGGYYRVGSPYMVGGRLYVPEADRHYDAVGLASWYGDDFHGRYTANGEIFDLNAISAAHPTLPLPCYVRVTNLTNRRSLIVRVNDRGPYVGDRIIDLSIRAAHLLGFYDRGTARVRVQYVGRAPMQGSDDRVLTATLRENEPAPLPSTILLAERPIFPPRPPPPKNDEIVASASGVEALSDPPGSRVASYRDRASGKSGTAQFLNGRGLY